MYVFVCMCAYVCVRCVHASQCLNTFQIFINSNFQHVFSLVLFFWSVLYMGIVGFSGRMWHQWVSPSCTRFQISEWMAQMCNYAYLNVFCTMTHVSFSTSDISGRIFLSISAFQWNYDMGIRRNSGRKWGWDKSTFHHLICISLHCYATITIRNNHVRFTFIENKMCVGVSQNIPALQKEFNCHVNRNNKLSFKKQMHVWNSHI